MKGRLFTLIIAGVSAISSFAAPHPTLLSIKETITDNAIVFPESFETDTKEMMQNWYIQNYTVLDADVEKRSSNDVSDAEYIKRLKAMPTVIEMPYNQVVRSYIDMYVKRRRTLVETMLGMSLYYMPIFEQALEKEGMPLELKYLPVIESALNPEAVSRVGATGLWQFMIGTAKGLGLEVNSLVDERRDPYRSSDKAAKYLKTLYNIYNDWSLAIAAYNCGPANVNKALRRAGSDKEKKDFWDIYPYLPKETRGYVPAFIAANYVMTYFKYHNISPGLAKKPIVTDTVSVGKRIHLQQIASVLNMPIEEIRVLNPQFRRDVIPATAERRYALALPSQQVYSFIMSEDSIVNFNRAQYAQREVVEPAEYKSESYNNGYTYETRLVTKYHKVRKGETLSKIARKYGVTTSSIKQANGMKRNSVSRGQVIKVSVYQKVKVPRKVEQTKDDVKDPNVEVEDNTINDANVTTDAADNEIDDEEEEAVEQKPLKSTKSSTKAATKQDKKKEQTSRDNATPTKKSSSGKAEKTEKSSSNKKAVKETDDKASTKSSGKKATAEKAEKASSKKSAKEATDDKSASKSSKNNSKKDSSKKETSKEKAASASSHKIKKGETLSEIAEKYPGVSVADIRKANNIKGTDIRAGETLVIPSKGASSASKSKSSKKSKRRR